MTRGLGVAVGALLIGLASCGDDGSGAAASPETVGESPEPTATATETSAPPAGDPAPADGEPFGSGCGRFTTGAGAGAETFAGEMELGVFSVIFEDVVGDSAALMNRSDLLAETDATYFLPTNEAIDVLGRDQSGDLIFDDEARLRVMGRHVVEGSLPPSALAGEHPTVNGSTVAVAVEGDDVRVGLQGARVLCGNIELEKGVRVYVIDQVLIT